MPCLPYPLAAHRLSTRIGRRRQKSPSRCIFSADDLRSCRPQQVENTDARRASADRLLSEQLHGKTSLLPESRTGFSLSCPACPIRWPRICFPPALVAGGRSLLHAAFSPLTTCRDADPSRSKMQTLVELPPTDSSVSGVTSGDARAAGWLRRRSPAPRPACRRRVARDRRPGRCPPPATAAARRGSRTTPPRTTGST